MLIDTPLDILLYIVSNEILFILMFLVEEFENLIYTLEKLQQNNKEYL
jgi:hypothetical protein